MIMRAAPVARFAFTGILMSASTVPGGVVYCPPDFIACANEPPASGATTFFCRKSRAFSIYYSLPARRFQFKVTEKNARAKHANCRFKMLTLEIQRRDHPLPRHRILLRSNFRPFLTTECCKSTFSHEQYVIATTITLLLRVAR